ncbi:MAG TPA: hypothetical protein VF607_00500 [Verrucomicrobiae bacterium]
MNTSRLNIRRAIIDDLPALQDLWLSMQLDPADLETRLTEFQVVERAGAVVGAIGFQILGTAGRLYGEGYSDYSVADAARALFWERIQTLAASHGVFRLWTQEVSPYWQHQDFTPPDADARERLPQDWQGREGKWLTLELKNEAVINAAYKTQMAKLSALEKQSAAELEAKARMMRTLIILGGFGVFFLCVGFVLWRMFHHRP